MSEKALRDMIDLVHCRVDSLRDDLDALSIRVNQLELAHNRLCHFVGGATEDTTIDRDNGAVNDMGTVRRVPPATPRSGSSARTAPPTEPRPSLAERVLAALDR